MDNQHLGSGVDENPSSRDVLGQRYNRHKTLSPPPPTPGHTSLACAHINLLHGSGGERGGGARLTPLRPEPQAGTRAGAGAWLAIAGSGSWARTGHTEPQPVPAWQPAAVLAATLWFQSSPLRPQDQTYNHSKIHNRLQILSSLKVNLLLQLIV